MSRMMLSVRSSLCTVLLWLFACAATAADTLDTIVLEELARQQIPGAAVAIVHNGKVLKAAGYGLANLEHRVSASAHTMFQSGSLGKQFSAVAVMLQVEAGRLALDDVISDFFPDAPAHWQQISVRHLLTHTSGIPDYTEDTIDYRRDYSEQELARIAFGLKPEFAPGERWSYSNTGYLLLGIIVRAVSGKFYADVLQEQVFDPLGMHTARVISERDIVAHRAAGYELVEGEIRNQEWVAPQLNTTADGALYLSVLDMIAWEAGVRARAILQPASWDAIFTPVRLNDGSRYPYGFGWSVDQDRGQPRQHHSGSWQGFTAYYSRYPESGLAVAVFTNLAQGEPGRIVERLEDSIDPTLTPNEPSNEAQGAAPPSACRASLEAQAAEPVLVLRAAADCKLSEQALRQVVRLGLVEQEKAAPAANLRALALGRLMRFPWASARLTSLAATSSEWDAAAGQASGGRDNAVVAQLLHHGAVFQTLGEELSAAGYAVAGITVEKVLVADTSGLPFDAQVWLQLKKHE